MQAVDDMALLREYATRSSEAAFETLVSRRVNVVYSAALRQVRDPHLAEEVTQAVFIILAQKAGKISDKTILTGWLFRTTRFAALAQIRAAAKLRRYEQEAHMQNELSTAAPDPLWEQMSPLLDEALATLGERDRQAVLLRFFENKSLAEVGNSLGTGEDTARKCVSRTLEKLHRYFNQRGVSSTTAIIAGAISTSFAQAAPVALAKSVSAVAIVKGSIASASILTLVKGTMKMMTWLKLKFAIGVGGAVLLAGGVATVAISQTSSGDKVMVQEIVDKSRDAYAALSSYSDTGTGVFEIGSQTIMTTFNTRLQRPNLYRIDWNQTTVISTNKGVVWSDGSGDNLQFTAPDFQLAAARQKQNNKTQKMPNMKTALALAMPLSGFAASTIPGTFFNQDPGDFAAPAVSGRYPLKREEDAKIGDIDCYVVSSGMIDLSKLPDIRKPGTASTTLWIGKGDFLIHQCRTKYVEKVDSSAPSDQAVDEAIKKSLAAQNKPATPEVIAAMRPQMKEIMKQVQSTLKSGFESGVVYTQTHESIVVNQKFSPSDFEQ